MITALHAEPDTRGRSSFLAHVERHAPQLRARVETLGWGARYRRHQVVDRGFYRNHVLLVLSGYCKAVRYDLDGAGAGGVLVHLSGPGDLLAEHLDGSGTSTAVTLDRTDVRAIPLGEFSRMLTQYSAVRNAVIATLPASHHRPGHGSIGASGPEVLAGSLARLHVEHPRCAGRLSLPLDAHDLAQHTGLSPCAVTDAAADLTARGLITTTFSDCRARYQQITILDPAALQHLALQHLAH